MKKFWQNQLDLIQINYQDKTLNGWLKWVSIQPILRRLFGNSFLPHHDYGKGGRGWRDLWQDQLTLLLMNPSVVKKSLISNFAGVRIDGSNATIIGEEDGTFKADRNHITRVWMDHGSWPFLTTKMYIDRTGDISILFEEVPYFKDQFTHYTKKIDSTYQNDSTTLKSNTNTIYKGTILEHLIIQNLVPYFNRGIHNNLRLEDADWNDALDMAKEHGESVAFTNQYGHNLLELSSLLRSINSFGYKEIFILKEISSLLTSTILDSKLNEYFDCTAKNVTGEKILFTTLELADYLKEKGDNLLNQVRENEWITGTVGSWFNSYYDNHSNPLDDAEKGNMMLTGQVFSIMSYTASKLQVKEIIKSVDQLLFKEELGGVLLNTNFKELKHDMGRQFAFAYGTKENGAMFSHMAVMYAYALYERGFVKEGYKILNTIYKHMVNIDKSHILPGIPEYVDAKGHGAYNYLTGSASWFILTEVQQVFGVQAKYGDILLKPQLLKEQFDDADSISITITLHSQPCTIIYSNPKHLEFGEYSISSVLLNDDYLKIGQNEKQVLIPKQKFKQPSTIIVTLN